MPIPDFEDGILPPFIGEDPASGVQAPYPAALADVVDRFGGAPERRRLLSGLLDYRAELHQAGLVSGFQWIDGSFVEDKEWLEGAAPSDIDVVTFYRLPAGCTQRTLLDAFPALFSSSARAGIKRAHSVDAYWLSLSQPVSEYLVKSMTYWHGLWSHKRYTRQWKGYL